MIKNNLRFNDFQTWKDANKLRYFSLYDYIAGISQNVKLPLDFWIAFSNLFLPKFLEIDGMIFIEELYNAKKEEYVRYSLEKQSAQKIEYWINMLCVDGYFLYLENPDDNAMIYLANKIKSGWELSLTNGFPSKKFKVELIDDQESGDLIVTFFQVTYDG